MRARSMLLGCLLVLASGCDTDSSRHGDPSRDMVLDSDASAPLQRDGEANALDDAQPSDTAPDGAMTTRKVPLLPVGYAAFEQLERLPVIRIGQRAYMASTYDRKGGNEGVDASHFLRAERDDFNVTLDVGGPGLLSFVRTNHWHGSPWHYVVDGHDIIVSESSTATPNMPVAGSVFLPERAFPPLLTYTWSTTRGADLSWVSIPFLRSMTLAYGRTRYGTGYYIYHRFPERAPNLPEPLISWTDRAQPPEAVTALLARAGQDIAPSTPDTTRTTAAFSVAKGKVHKFAELSDGPRTLRKLTLSVPKGQELALNRARLRISWDDASPPQVDAPIVLFFGAGTLYNREQREYLVKGLLTNIRFGERVELSSYFPMPYGKSARFELVAAGADLTDVQVVISSEPSAEEPALLGHFHATYSDFPEPAQGDDMVLLDTTKVEGGGRSYCGLFTGMSFIFSERGNYTTLEGDPRFFFDDSNTPQAQGTGTEEWGGGGDYWGGDTMTLPLAGHPVGAPYLGVRNGEDAIESAYRVLISDAMPFGKNARIQLEHGATNQSDEHYRAVTYWYGKEDACLVQTDELHVGDENDERAHHYVSPEASAVQTLTSRYDLGIDRVGFRDVYPARTDTGRYTSGTSELTLAIDPNNVGVMLRRKLDYGFADQRAEVFVAKDEPGAPFQPAGVWSTAGSNRCVYSNPPGELDGPIHQLQESNRRWREEEFLLPPELTVGLSKIRLRFRYVPDAKPLLPGEKAPPSAWSEYRYWAYSYVMPGT